MGRKERYRMMDAEIDKKVEEAIRRMEEARDKDKIAEYPYNRCIRILREVMNLKEVNADE